ncbi:MAG: class I SAM-dependent methyltransferase, partial [Alphaproteobacteria bacterium]
MLTPADNFPEPSPWIVRFAPLVPVGAVLDVAAGAGRHARLFALRGHPVTAVDRDIARLAPGPRVAVVEADLEAGPWPFPGRGFAGVVVTNYLHRPLFPHLIGAVAPGGVLL